MYTNTVQNLNNIDIKLFELQITLSKYCLAGTDVHTDGRRKQFLDLLPPSVTQVKTVKKQIAYIIIYKNHLKDVQHKNVVLCFNT